ncbi:MAG TPA: hypothetical protein VNI55_09320 [Gaiellaceae bacterium]|nr:hypothetical protein [Gaiellaceae bacterium]
MSRSASRAAPKARIASTRQPYADARSRLATARRAFLVLAASLALAAGVSAAEPPRDAASLALTILPPGENGGVAFDRNTTDQAKLYDALTPLQETVTDRDLRRTFKPAPLVLAGKAARTQNLPRKGVTIRRDSFGCPT